MKRMIALLLCMALVCSLATTAFATEINEDSEMQSTMSQIIYNLDTKYCIYIPEEIDASTGSYTFEASYLAVSETEQVVVRMSGVDDLGNITLENGASEKLTLNVVYDGAGLMPNGAVAIFTDSTTANAPMQLVYNNYGKVHRPGQYSGTFEFTVSVEDRT